MTPETRDALEVVKKHKVELKDFAQQSFSEDFFNKVEDALTFIIAKVENIESAEKELPERIIIKDIDDAKGVEDKQIYRFFQDIGFNEALALALPVVNQKNERIRELEKRLLFDGAKEQFTGFTFSEQTLLEENKKLQSELAALKDTECADTSITEAYLKTLSELNALRGRVDEGKIYCVITAQEKWGKPEGCGFIYRNLLGVYFDIYKAKALQKRFMNFTGGDWKSTNGEEYKRENCLLKIIELNASQDMQIFDCNH